MFRPTPLPASPHLRQSHVLKMLNEEGQEIVDQEQWPPTARYSGAPRPHDFLSKCTVTGAQKIAWPPHLDHEGINDAYLLQQDPTYQKQEPKELTEGQDEKSLPLGTAHPSGFKLREEAPMSQPSVSIVPSQPAFKISKPLKMSGDSKWPPRKDGEEAEITQDEVRDFIRPKKANRDYSEFFAQNALPSNFPGYRAPPGTQHRGVDSEEVELEAEE